MNIVEKARAIQEFGTLRVQLKDAGSMKLVERAKAIQRFAELRVLLGGKVATATEEVLSDDPNSPNYRYRDTGYIADSRKEQASSHIRMARASGQMLRASDVDWDAIEQNPRAATEIIIKSNLFGQVDWQSLRTGGMDSAAGFLIDRVYASIAPQPVLEGALPRRDYALGLETIRSRLEVCNTVDEVRGVINEVKEELMGSNMNADDSAQYASMREQIMTHRDQVYAIRQQRDAARDFMDLAYRDKLVLDDDISKRKQRGWVVDPEKNVRQTEATQAYETAKAAWVAVLDDTRPDIDQHEKQIQNLYRQISALESASRERSLRENPLTRAWLTFGERFLNVLRYRHHKGSTSFRSHVTNAASGKIKDWSWAEKERAVLKQATKQEIGFQLRVADQLERVGGKPVTVNSTLDLKQQLGFRDVQSGNWVLKDPNSAKFHVEQTAAAMSDMGDILGIDPSMLGLGGRLAMAFGARGTGSAGSGQSGAARAHYESTHRVINLTKMGGGGALGHEWFHAIDDMLTELVTQEPSQSKRAFVTIDPSRLPAGKIRDAVEQLRTAMLTGTTRKKETINIIGMQRLAKSNIDSAYPNQLAKMIKNAGDGGAAVIIVDDYFAQKGKMSKQTKQNYLLWRGMAAAYHAPEHAPMVTLETGAATSEFMNAAMKLDGGVSGKYWSRPHEMAARAFQSYLEDTLGSQGRKNDYLSVFASNQHHADPLLSDGWKPYPEGEERTRLNAAFARLFEVIRTEQVFEKATQNKVLMDALFDPQTIKPDGVAMDGTAVDAKAHEAATSPLNDLPEPTDQQKKAGMYQMGEFTISGLTIKIENPEGSVRSGVTEDGVAWETTLQHHYGYIKSTEGADGDEVDVFVKVGTPDDFSGDVYVIDQLDQADQEFDEHKVVIGADGEDDAKDVYLSNYDADWTGLGAITAMSWDEFKAWVRSDSTHESVALEGDEVGVAMDSLENPSTTDYHIHSMPLASLAVDPEKYQWRKNTTADGTESDRVVEGEWNQTQQPPLVVHAQADGGLYVVDGHHRFKLATLNDVESVDAIVLREDEGYSVDAVRVLCGMLNLRKEVDYRLPIINMAETAHHLTQQIESVMGWSGVALDEVSDDVPTLPSSASIDSMEEANAYWKAHFANKTMKFVVHTKDKMGQPIQVPITVYFDPANNHAFTVDPDKTYQNRLRPFDATRAQAMDRIFQTICYPKHSFRNLGSNLLLEAIQKGQHYTIALRWSDGGRKYNFASAHFKEKVGVDKIREGQRRESKNAGPLDKRS